MTAVAFIFLCLGLFVSGVVLIARHDKALAWRRDVAAAIEVAHSYRKASRR